MLIMIRKTIEFYKKDKVLEENMMQFMRINGKRYYLG